MLAVVEIDGAGRQDRKLWLAPGQTIRVGRTEKSDVALPQDPALAPIHFVLTCTHDTCRVASAGSHAVWVNGRATQGTELHGGDVLQAGASRFRITLEGVPALSAPQPRETGPAEVDALPASLRFLHETARPGLMTYRIEDHRQFLPDLVQRLHALGPLAAICERPARDPDSDEVDDLSELLFNWLPPRCSAASPHIVAPLTPSRAAALARRSAPSESTTLIVAAATGTELYEGLRRLARGQACDNAPPQAAHMLLDFDGTVLEEVLPSADASFLASVFSLVKLFAFQAPDTRQWVLISAQPLDGLLLSVRVETTDQATAISSLASTDAPLSASLPAASTAS